jgi:hypothetical protein
MNQEFFQRLRQQGITHVGLPWFEAQSYQQVVAIMEDRHGMHRTHAQWQAGARKTEEALRREGFVTVRAVLRLPDFIDFCTRHGQRVNAEGRTHFASFVAAQAQRKGMEH